MKRENIIKKFLSVFLATGLIISADLGFFTGSTTAYDEQSELLRQIKKDTQETKAETEKDNRANQEMKNQGQQNQATERKLEAAPVAPVTNELRSISTD